MRSQCRYVPEYKKGDLQKGDQWIVDQMEGFKPESGAASLRLLSMTEAAPEVALAIQEIRSTCKDYRDGKVDENTADGRLSGYEEIIQNFLEKMSNEGKLLAATGDVTKIGQIRGILTNVAADGRQNSLLGEDMLADAARQIMIDTVETFDQAFTQNCDTQSFDRDIALALERQSSELGLPTDVMHCAYRRAEAKWSSGKDSIMWKHCGLVVGKWKVESNGTFVCKGEGFINADSNGEYSAHYTGFGRYRSDLKETGTLYLHCVEGKACDCIQHPEKKECKGVDTSQIKNLLSVRGNSFTGPVYFPAPIGPQPPDPELATRGLLWQDYPVIFQKSDKPCIPDDEEEPKPK